MSDLAAREVTPSWLMPESLIYSNQAKATRLGMIMRKAGLRKRIGTGFVVNVERDLVSFFAGCMIPLYPKSKELTRAQMAFKVAAKARRGPKRLSGTSLSDRADGKIQRNLEHTLRLKRRLRHERALEGWAKEVADKGETALTTSIRPPKF